MLSYRMLNHSPIGTGQSTLPGGLRTGAPGEHVVKGKAKYRLVDEKVRYFVAPSIQAIEESPVSILSYMSRPVTFNDHPHS